MQHLKGTLKVSQPVHKSIKKIKQDCAYSGQEAKKNRSTDVCTLEMEKYGVMPFDNSFIAFHSGVGTGGLQLALPELYLLKQEDQPHLSSVAEGYGTGFSGQLGW